MAQAPRERKKPILQLEQLPPVGEWPKSGTKHTENADPELEDVAEPGSQHRPRVEAVGPEQVDKPGQRQVKINVLHAQQHRERDTAV